METRIQKPPRVTWFELAIHAILLFVLLACVFPGVFMRGDVALPGGLLFDTPPWNHHTPPGVEVPKNWLTVENLQQINKWYFLAQKAFEGGEWPLWNPFEFSGLPLLANFQSAVFYPFRLLHTFLNHDAATTLFILLKLWLCGFTAYLYGRYIRLSPATARFLSIAWMLSTYNLIWCYWPVPDVSAWAFVILLGVECLLDGRYRRGFLSMTIGAVLILLAAHPETALSLCLGIGLYFALRLVVERRWGRALYAPLGLAGAAWALALLVCAVQLIPFFEYLLQSHTYLNREGDLGGVHALPNSAHLVLWVARFFGTTAEGTYWGDTLNSTFLGMLYPGVAVWLGVVLCARRSAGQPRDAVRRLCLAIPCALSILMSFDIPWLRPIQTLPGLGAMWRCYYISFAKMGLPILAALGLEYWFAHPRRPRALIAPALIVAALALYVAGAAHFLAGLMRTLSALHASQGQASVSIPHYVHIQLLTAALFAAAGLLLLALHVLRPSRRLWPALLTALLAIDLIWAVRGLLPTSPPEALFPQTQLTSFLQDLPKPNRISIVSTGTIRPTLMYPYGIEDHWGHDGMYPERIITFYGRLGESIWNAVEPVCGINYYLRNPEKACGFPYFNSSRFHRVTALDGIEVYENLRALPRAFLVGRLESAASVDALFERMASSSFDPTRSAITEASAPANAPQTAGDVGIATVLSRTFTRVVVEAEAKADCVLVLSDAYFPGWEAHVDGIPTPIFPVYYTFRGIVLPAGAHRIEYVYAPWTFRAGLAASTTTLLAGLAASIWMLRRFGTR